MRFDVLFDGGLLVDVPLLVLNRVLNRLHRDAGNGALRVGRLVPARAARLRHHQVLVLVVDALVYVPRVCNGSLEPSHRAVGVAADVRPTQRGRDRSMKRLAEIGLLSGALVRIRETFNGLQARFVRALRRHELGKRLLELVELLPVALVPRQLPGELDEPLVDASEGALDVAVALARALALFGGGVLHDARAVEGDALAAQHLGHAGNLVHGGGRRRATGCDRRARARSGGVVCDLRSKCGANF